MMRTVLIFAIIPLIFSCSLIRDVRKEKRSEQSRSETDSTAVNRSRETNSSGSEFERIIKLFGQPKGDTTIQNIHIHNPGQQPLQAVIYERGSQQQASSRETVDSNARNAIVDLATLMQTKDKEEQGQVLGFWHLAGIALAAGIISALFSKIKIGLKNEKAHNSP